MSTPKVCGKLLLLVCLVPLMLGQICNQAPSDDTEGGGTGSGQTTPDPNNTSNDSGQPTPTPTTPKIQRAVATNSTTVVVTFSHAMEDAAGSVGFYHITPALKIISAVLSADRLSVTLTTATQSDTVYTLQVGDLMTAAGELIDPARMTVTFFGIAANDTAPVRVVSAQALSNTSVVVAFSKPVGDSAENVTAHKITVVSSPAMGPTSLVVSAAALNKTRTEVTLTTGRQYRDQYRVVVSGVQDDAGNGIDPGANSATFAGIELEQYEKEDKEFPRVVGAISTSNTTVLVTFSKPMSDSVLEPAHYMLGTTNVVSEAGGLVVTSVQFLGADRTAVELTTLSQSQVQYDVMVVNVKDEDGNPLAARQYDPGGVVIDPTVGTFWGTGVTTVAGGGTSGSGGPVDTDGDGLTDDVEQRGWVVTVVRADGSSEARDVSSDPTVKDSDGDGLDDRQEHRRGTDPRVTDTDGDLISDKDEIDIHYSSPLHQDTDAEGLDDSMELLVHKTSLIRKDTDGDGFTDYEEIYERNRNPRIADLPRPRVDVGDMALRLDTRFSYTDTQGVSQTKEESSSTNLSESQTKTFAFSDSRTTTNTIEASTQIGIEKSWGLTGSGTGFGGFSNKFSFTASAGYSYSDEKTSTVSQESAESAQRAYEESLTTSETVDETQSVTREVVGASMDVAVTIANVGDTAFSMTNVEITALQQDPLNKNGFLPVATLIPAATLSTGVIPKYTTGPFIPTRGPFMFSSREIFPSLVEDLLKNPRGLIFRVANFDVEDEFGRNLAFVSQEVNDRTAGLTFDYGNGTVDRYRVATCGIYNDQTAQYLGGFDAKGREKGLPMGFVLQETLGLVKNGEPDAITVGDDGCAQTWASGDDIQIVTPVCPPVTPGGVIITAGPNGRLESVPRGDDLRIGDVVRDGGDGCAHSVAAGDDMTIVQGACAAGDDDGIVVLAGPNGIVDSRARADDQIMATSGYATTIVDRCDGDTLDAIVEPVNLLAQTVAVGDDVQEVPYGDAVQPGDIIVSAGVNGVIDSIPNGNDVLNITGDAILEPDRTAETTAAGDDIQEIAAGNPAQAGELIVTAGPNGVLDTTAAGNDARVGPGYSCVNGCPQGICKQTEILTRVKGVENDDEASRFWIMFTEADIDRGADFDDIILKATDTFALAYVQDKDDDDLFAREEYIYGSSDRRINSDGCPDPADPSGPGFLCNDPSCADFDTDCVTDYEEVKVGWEIEVEGQAVYMGYANPVQPDSDADDVLDSDERVFGTDPSKSDTDDDGISDGEEIYGFTIYKKDRETVIRHVDPFETLVLVDGGNAVVETPLAGDDRWVNAGTCDAGAPTPGNACNTHAECRDTTHADGLCLNPAAPTAGAIIITPGVNGVLESLGNGDDTTQLSQVILDGGNGVVESAPVGDDFLSPGAGDMLITVNFQSYNAGNLDCDAADASVGQCDAISTNVGDECLQDADCLGEVGGICEFPATGTCDANSVNAGDACTGDADCTDQVGTCVGAVPPVQGICGADSQNAGDPCDDDAGCIGLVGTCEIPGACDAQSANAGDVCADDNDCTPTSAACDKPHVCDDTSDNKGDPCLVDGDCPNGLCVEELNRRPVGEYILKYEITRTDAGGTPEAVYDDQSDILPIDGGEGTVLLGSAADFSLTQGQSFTVNLTISEVDTDDTTFEQNMPGNETPADWAYSESFQYTDLSTHAVIQRTLLGPAGGCAGCCLEEDEFVFTIQVGGTVRPGGVVVRPGPNGKLDTVPGGDDLKAVPHHALFATDPLNRDTDADTLSDGLERKLGANPNDFYDVGRFRDSDYDGLTDGEERDGWFIGYTDPGGAVLCRNGDGDFIVVPDPQRPPASCVIITSDPLEPDTDLDKLPDALEKILRSDPRKRDTDGDSLTDYDEFDSESAASISYVDFRDFRDVCEPADRCSYDPADSKLYGTCVVKADTDADGLADAEEIFGGWVVSPCEQIPYYVLSNPTEADADLDGWSDGREQGERTDPNKADTDGDAAVAGGGIDSTDPFPSGCGKLIKVTIVKWEVGDDDCDGVGRGEGDFSYHFDVFRDGGERIGGPWSGSDIQIDSDETYTLDLATSTFALTPGQTFTVSGYTDEDDPTPSSEPDTWHFSKTFEFATVAPGVQVFDNGPDCFSDDKITFRIDVIGG